MATVDLRQAARAAWEAKESDRIAAARAALGDVLGTENATAEAVDVADVVEFTGGYTVAFVDAGGVHVAVTVRDSGTEVRLVRRGGDGTWTTLGRVTSLAHLWELIEAHLPAEPMETAPAWDTQVAYAVGDRATYDGATYEAIQAHTSQTGWEPPNVPALWAVM